MRVNANPVIPAPKPVSLADIEAFAARLTEALRAEHNKHYPTLDAGVWQIDGSGQRFVRIVHKNSQTMCYAFVERETGFVYKPDGWKKPAKHARGALHDATNGLGCCGLYGISYLR